MKLSNTFNRLRWRHWLLLSLLVLVLVIKWSPYLGYIYTLYIYSTIGRILSSFSGIFPFAIGDIFIALSIAWVILYPLYEIVLRKDGMGKSGRISAMDLRMVLHGLGTQLLAAQHLSAHRHDAG